MAVDSGATPIHDARIFWFFARPRLSLFVSTSPSLFLLDISGEVLSFAQVQAEFCSILKIPGRDTILANPVHSRHARDLRIDLVKQHRQQQRQVSHSTAPSASPPHTQPVCLPPTPCTTLPAPGRSPALSELLLYVHRHGSAMLQKPLTPAYIAIGTTTDAPQETPLKRSAVQQRRWLAIHEYRSAALLESVRMLHRLCRN